MNDDGAFEADGQPPIVVVEGNALPDGMHGPWVAWRFPWDQESTYSLWFEFDAMVRVAGYRRVRGEA